MIVGVKSVIQEFVSEENSKLLYKTLKPQDLETNSSFLS
jgi:hypothetical protein